MTLNPSDSAQAGDAITAFDSVYTTNSIQLLKLALPLLCEPARPFLAALVKAQELSYCYQLLKHTNMRSFSVVPQELDTFLHEAQQFCTPEQRSLFRSLEQFQRAMRLLEKMQLLNEEMPFSEEGDLGQLLLLMPQLFGQETQAGDARKKEPEGARASCGDPDSHDTAGECTSGKDSDGKDTGDKASGDKASGDKASDDKASGNKTSGNKTSGDKDSGDKASAAHEKNTSPPLPSMLTEALTPRQKELFAGYMQRFSDH